MSHRSYFNLHQLTVSSDGMSWHVDFVYVSHGKYSLTAPLDVVNNIPFMNGKVTISIKQLCINFTLHVLVLFTFSFLCEQTYHANLRT